MTDKTKKYKVWSCKIVVPAGALLPNGFDAPPRRAAMDVVSGHGVPIVACFSGWGGELDPVEQEVIEEDD